MARKNTSKINRIIRHMPNGALLTNQWLQRHNITNKLAWWYVHSGWLGKVAHKLYKKSGGNIAWYDAVLALQQQLKLPVHIGGKTALQFLGKSHYVPVQTIRQFDLYETQKVKLPAWLNKIPECQFRFRVSTRQLFKHGFAEGIIAWQFHEFEIQISSPERAIIELLSNVPQQYTFEEAYLLMENLSRLRSEIVQTLLEKCSSVKAKRLFLYLAEQCQHEWLDELNIKKINLGVGKRKIGSGGIFDSKYKISIPKIMAE